MYLICFYFYIIIKAMIGHGASLLADKTNITNLEEFNKLMEESFLDSVNSFAINNTILGVIMLGFSYLSIMLFNYAAHSQVRIQIYNFILICFLILKMIFLF